MTPVQRIPRYILLLKEIIKVTGDEHPDKDNLVAALEAVKKYADDMNKTVKLSENKKEFVRLSSIIDGLSLIKSPLLFSDETVQISADAESYTWMILFSDRLVFVRDKTVAQEYQLVHIWVKDSVIKASDCLMQLVTPSNKIMIECEIPQNKRQWIERLSVAIDQELMDKNMAAEENGDRSFAFKWTSQRDKSVSIYQGVWRDALPHGNGKYKYSTKASYEGQFIRGKRHGKGKMFYPSGASMECEWEDGLPSGAGKLVSAASEYEGEMLKGELTGEGKLTHPDGSTYSGGFAHGYYHGQGLLTDKSGTVYSGEFVNGLRHGQGELKGPMGAYKGMWKDDRQCDENATMTFAQGDVFCGAFVDGLPCGKGVLTRSVNGSVYEGEFAAGVYHGSGVLKERDGAFEYTGGFAEGRRSGKGVQKYDNDDVYTGEWLNGRRSGQGKFSFYKTFVYEGNWDDGHFHGRGKLSDSTSGRVMYDGHWKMGRREGKGYSTYEDGTKYTGGFVNDLRDGVGVLENATAKWKYGGDWVKGRRHGKGELTAPNYRYEGEWVDDRRTGLGKERVIDSSTSFEGQFLNDRRLTGKVSVEQQGKIPIHVDVDYEQYGTVRASDAMTNLPPPVVGISFALFEVEYFSNYS